MDAVKGSPRNVLVAELLLLLSAPDTQMKLRSPQHVAAFKVRDILNVFCLLVNMMGRCNFFLRLLRVRGGFFCDL